ncbi:cyclopropane-fatty-acyl-phospholipid synthase [Gilliamella sp. wkB108]|uniref:cyclopropane fatty acyl phospholipid synthase n=1 Tax=Gilliamella sp. wkB108 TaxID=3120256 RepID=UPI00080E77DC|nr:cyclopropane fatty acyl phospholipid synthase [Gilliamella apicola]OCG22438.1 cyclopropane-fatty-acyl-phospholipid synthase [Gilliamella apicola]
MTNPKRLIEKLLAQTPIKINGQSPWDIKVKDESFYSQVLHQGSIGFGESYVEGKWESEQLDELIRLILLANLEKKVGSKLDLMTKLQFLFFNLQSKTRAYIVGKKHYDFGNDLFEKMLDKGLNYSCGYWKNANNLDEAQEAKLDLIAKKLGLQSGMKVLDVGCGWGGFSEFAARHYGCKVKGITISKEQAEYAEQRCKNLPVEIRLKDYRDLHEHYDRIVSIGMFEHVGYKNYAIYFAKLYDLLADGGLFLLHTIGTNTSHFGNDPWINKYIFPNGVLPSIAQLIKGTEGKFVMEDWQNFGPDYDKTLLAWYGNFVQNWPTLKSKYSNETFRMFKYYLLCCAGAFRARNTQLWQVVFSKNRSERYDAPR